MTYLWFGSIFHTILFQVDDCFFFVVVVFFGGEGGGGGWLAVTHCFLEEDCVMSPKYRLFSLSRNKK